MSLKLSRKTSSSSDNETLKQPCGNRNPSQVCSQPQSLSSPGVVLFMVRLWCDPVLFCFFVTMFFDEILYRVQRPPGLTETSRHKCSWFKDVIKDKLFLLNNWRAAAAFCSEPPHSFLYPFTAFTQQIPQNINTLWQECVPAAAVSSPQTQHIRPLFVLYLPDRLFCFFVRVFGSVQCT